jgi:hypothetical protein
MDDNGLQIVNQPVTAKREGLALDGPLGIPPTAVGVVVFAHGSGSGRFSPRNNFFARQLQQGRVATLLIDLLTLGEAENRRKVSTSTCWQSAILRSPKAARIFSFNAG